ncbi:hypothetical protein ACFQPA_11830 [Halomarina halobia]|uniref:Glycerophosphoryl diester phosphodiesterase membrane domain-containing protein n=1 Tax=Halomarina halobia TaxID=3033386 RepID=A0ABD6AAM1_9EURY|nr:hypothetical protein [Halomarina sp. PSR21]
MTLYALDDLDDALDATRSFLLPFDARRWLKLALVVFFVGGLGANVPAGGNVNVGDASSIDVGALPALPADVVTLAVALAAAVLVVALLFALVGSAMEFVLLEALRSDEVAVRRDGRRHLGKALGLFGFRLLLALVGLALAALALAPVWLALTGGGAFDPRALVAGLALLLPVAAFVGVVLGVVNGFTTVFVVPIMLLEDRGVLAAWRRFWPTLVGAWRQYVVYAVAAFVLNVVGATAVGIVAGLGALVLFVPFGILGWTLFGGALAAGTLSTAGWVALAALLVAFALVAAAVFAVVQVPVQTYLRYYALFVLGDTDAELDLIPDRRKTVRSGEDAIPSA